jgi:hypothetical protein
MIHRTGATKLLPNTAVGGIDLCSHPSGGRSRSHRLPPAVDRDRSYKDAQVVGV